MITAEIAENAEKTKQGMDEKDRLDQLTRRIIGAAIEVHKQTRARAIGVCISELLGI